MIKKEVNFVIILALFVSVGVFVILSDYVFNFKRVFTLIRESKPVVYVMGEKKKNDISDFSDGYGQFKGNSQSIDKDKFTTAAKKYTDDILISIQNHDYSKVYSQANNRMKDIGSEDQFTAYMESINSIYGTLTDIKFHDYSISKDNTEIKLNYNPYSSKMNKKIMLTIWVKTEGKFNLSGIKFAENSW